MKLKKTLVISLAALAITTSAYAMRPGGGPCGGKPPGPPKIELLQDELDLTDEQASSLKALFAEQKAKHRKMRRERGKERRAMREQMKEKLAKILTESQMEDFKDMMPGKHGMKSGMKPGKQCRNRF